MGVGGIYLNGARISLKMVVFEECLYYFPMDFVPMARSINLCQLFYYSRGNPSHQRQVTEPGYLLIIHVVMILFLPKVILQFYNFEYLIIGQLRQI